MSKFDFMEFNNGDIVFHANKYTVETAAAKLKEEYPKDDFTDREIQTGYCRYFVKAPEGLQYDFPDGCYSYCDKSTKGAFPVIVFSGN